MNNRAKRVAAVGVVGAAATATMGWLQYTGSFGMRKILFTPPNYLSLAMGGGLVWAVGAALLLRK